MAVSAICCPKCGAGLEGGVVGSTVRCRHCGSSLRITRSASGSLQAILAEIELNTEYVAKETALARLESTLAPLVAEKQRLEGQIRAEIDHRVNEVVPPRERGWADACIIGGLIFMLTAMSAMSEAGVVAVVVILVSIVGLVIGVCANANQETERRTLVQQVMPGIQAKVRAQYGPTLAALDAEIANTQGSIDRLREEVLQMAREV